MREEKKIELESENCWQFANLTYRCHCFNSCTHYFHRMIHFFSHTHSQNKLLLFLPAVNGIISNEATLRHRLMNQHDATHRLTVYRPFRGVWDLIIRHYSASSPCGLKIGRGAEVKPARLSHTSHICIYIELIYRYRCIYIYR